jgi:hypothetical protein
LDASEVGLDPYAIGQLDPSSRSARMKHVPKHVEADTRP